MRSPDRGRLLDRGRVLSATGRNTSAIVGATGRSIQPITPMYYAQQYPLRYWLRADLGITIDTGVSAWADQSGNGISPVQATASKQPAYDASGGPNGRAAVLPDGTDDFLEKLVANAGATFTRIAVAKWDAAYVAQSSMLDGGTTNVARMFRHTDGGYHMFAGATVTATGQTETDWHVYTQVWNGTSSAHRVDGTTVASGNVGTAQSRGITIGAIGGGTGDWADCSVAEVFEFTSLLPTNVEAHLVDSLLTWYDLP